MLLANFNRKEHLRHRAVSLRQHGFLVNNNNNTLVNNNTKLLRWSIFQNIHYNNEGLGQSPQRGSPIQGLRALVKGHRVSSPWSWWRYRLLNGACILRTHGACIVVADLIEPKRLRQRRWCRCYIFVSSVATCTLADIAYRTRPHRRHGRASGDQVASVANKQIYLVWLSLFFPHSP